MSDAIPISRRQKAVTPSDATNFVDGASEGLWIGVGGTISYVPHDPALAFGTAAALATTVPAGLFPVSAVRVNSTGTTATGILALY